MCYNISKGVKNMTDIALEFMADDMDNRIEIAIDQILRDYEPGDFVYETMKQWQEEALFLKEELGLDEINVTSSNNYSKVDGKLVAKGFEDLI